MSSPARVAPTPDQIRTVIKDLRWYSKQHEATEDTAIMAMSTADALEWAIGDQPETEDGLILQQSFVEFTTALRVSRTAAMN